MAVELDKHQMNTIKSSKRWRRLLVGLMAALGVATILIGAAYEIDVYTESNAFCTLCHAVYPEHAAYQGSPHARVDCAQCHIGPGLTPKIKAKLFGLRELYLTLTNTYGRPIPPPVETLRPAAEICEACHWPEKFYEDRVREIVHIAPDEDNTETRTYLVMKTGGGESHLGRGRGIHWHIENPVWYAATDEGRQEIPWVGVELNGKMVEYVAVDAPQSAIELAQLPRRKMDCMDCHNRATHVFPSPERRLDEAMALGRIPRDLPFFKQQASQVWVALPHDAEEAMTSDIEGIEIFYQNEYPDLYADRKADIQAALAVVREISDLSSFPDMKVSWQTYPNNIGHSDAPGCFRCHDGKHFSREGESIRLDCNICHSIPETVKLGESAVRMEIATIREPDTHLAANFIADHRFQADESCTACHGPIGFGTDDSSFCANSACHGQAWPEVDLDAADPHPIQLEGKHAEALCYQCHDAVRKPAYVCASCHQPPTEPHFGPDDCETCHQAVGWAESAAPLVRAAPPMAHPLAGNLLCLRCHDEGGLVPRPADHKGRPQETCSTCHEEGGPSPAIAHGLEGRDNCLMCHAVDSKVKPAPAGHEGRTNELCQLCH
ncbi:MAG: hypothetical protein E3J25_05325 [Anaerolineales bacterium]|nr:MAG: hypothetical protein E3J25_05325 [Anaerolineales bacterium]